MYTQSNINSALSTLKKGQFGIYVVAKTSCDNKLCASGKHYKGRIEKMTIIENVRLGCSYQGMVESKADTDFTPQPMKGFRWVSYPYIKESLKSGSWYLNVCYRPSDKRTVIKSYYLLDGQVATKEQIADFEQYFYATKRAMSSTQIAVGVAQQDETRVLSYIIEGIAYIGTSKNDAYKAYEG